MDEIISIIPFAAVAVIIMNMIGLHKEKTVSTLSYCAGLLSGAILGMCAYYAIANIFA